MPDFTHVVLVVFENHEASSIRGNPDTPTFNALLGPTVKRGSRFARATNHYALLRTIEDAWKVPRFGSSRTATPIGGIWR